MNSCSHGAAGTFFLTNTDSLIIDNNGHNATASTAVNLRQQTPRDILIRNNSIVELISGSTLKFDSLVTNGTAVLKIG